MDSLTAAIAQSGNLAVIVAAMAYVSLLGLVVFLLRERGESLKAQQEIAREAIAADMKMVEALTLLRVTIEGLKR